MHKTNINQLIFVAFAVFLVTSGIIASSGFACAISYNETATIVILSILLSLYVKNRKIEYANTKLGFVNLGASFFFLMLMKVYEAPPIFATNILTIFGLFGFIFLLKQVPWGIMEYRNTGHIFCVTSLCIMYLLLPGKAMSGWNPNSSICVFAPFLLGVCLLCISKSSFFQKVSIYFYFFFAFSLQLRLENRSTFLALLFFLIIVISKWYLKRTFCLLLILGTLILNFSLPIFQTLVTKNVLFRTVSSILMESFNKSALNGRDEIWPIAITRIAESPLIGNPNSRQFYFHNFSIDVLLQFGLLGLVTWLLSVWYIAKNNVRHAGKENIFFTAFSMIVFLNTFENVLFANNYLMPLPYALIAIPIYLKQHETSYGK